MKTIFIATALAFTFTSNSFAFQCNECHSKNPKLVTMHKELGYKDCGKCHERGMRMRPSTEKTELRKPEGPLCIGCHKPKE